MIPELHAHFRGGVLLLVMAIMIGLTTAAANEAVCVPCGASATASNREKIEHAAALAIVRVLNGGSRLAVLRPRWPTPFWLMPRQDAPPPMRAIWMEADVVGGTSAWLAFRWPPPERSAVRRRNHSDLDQRTELLANPAYYQFGWNILNQSELEQALASGISRDRLFSAVMARREYPWNLKDDIGAYPDVAAIEIPQVPPYLTPALPPLTALAGPREVFDIFSGDQIIALSSATLARLRSVMASDGTAMEQAIREHIRRFEPAWPNPPSPDALEFLRERFRAAADAHISGLDPLEVAQTCARWRAAGTAAVPRPGLETHRVLRHAWHLWTNPPPPRVRPKPQSWSTRAERVAAMHKGLQSIRRALVTHGPHGFSASIAIVRFDTPSVRRGLWPSDRRWDIIVRDVHGQERITNVYFPDGKIPIIFNVYPDDSGGYGAPISLIDPMLEAVIIIVTKRRSEGPDFDPLSWTVERSISKLAIIAWTAPVPATGPMSAHQTRGLIRVPLPPNYAPWEADEMVMDRMREQMLGQGEPLRDLQLDLDAIMRGATMATMRTRLGKELRALDPPRR